VAQKSFPGKAIVVCLSLAASRTVDLAVVNACFQLHAPNGTARGLADVMSLIFTVLFV
jgi:hypothetical protein